MSDTTTTTTVSEPRPVSALEQTLIGIIDRLDPLLDQDTIIVYGNAAKIVHERDAQMRALLDKWNIIANPPEDENWRYGMTTDEERMAYAECIREIRAILEGRTQP